MGRRRVANQPIRLAAGSFILNAGIGKLSADEERAAGVHGMAKSSFPFFDKLPAEQFTKGLAASEVALGAALVLPVVSDQLAGLGLTAFAGGLMWMYLQTDAMHEPNSIRPSRAGTALAKDVWLLGIGLTLLATGGKGRAARHKD
ncbi:MAG: hypothetical protein ACRDVW_02220 [Acidimicrobiales bacterium]